MRSEHEQKVWVRRVYDETYPWEIGCMECGHVIDASMNWTSAMWAAGRHVNIHRRERQRCSCYGDRPCYG